MISISEEKLLLENLDKISDSLVGESDGTALQWETMRISLKLLLHHIIECYPEASEISKDEQDQEKIQQLCSDVIKYLISLDGSSCNNNIEKNEKTLYDIMKENIERNRNVTIAPVTIPPKSRRVQEVENNMERICNKIKIRNGWV